MNPSRRVRSLFLALALTVAGSLQADVAPKPKLPAGALQNVLDDLKIMSLSPASGAKIPGPPEGTTGSGLNDSNSILITYQYKLQSSPQAQVRQWAWTSPNHVAYNNFWTWAPVSQGNGFAKTRLTVLCKNASQADTHVRLINYKLYRSDNVQPNELVDKVEHVDYTFTCGPTLNVRTAPLDPRILNPDELTIVSLSPPSGSTIAGPPQGTSASGLNGSNSILITYQYKLQSSPRAQIWHWAWSGQSYVANSFLTWKSVDHGNGTATTRLTVLCKNASKADTAVSLIAHKLRKEVDGLPTDDLVSRSLPVNYKFTCGP